VPEKIFYKNAYILTGYYILSLSAASLCLWKTSKGMEIFHTGRRYLQQVPSMVPGFRPNPGLSGSRFYGMPR